MKWLYDIATLHMSVTTKLSSIMLDGIYHLFLIKSGSFHIFIVTFYHRFVISFKLSESSALAIWSRSVELFTSKVCTHVFDC